MMWDGTLGRSSLQGVKSHHMQATFQRPGYSGIGPEAEFTALARNMIPGLLLKLEELSARNEQLESTAAAARWIVKDEDFWGHELCYQEDTIENLPCPLCSELMKLDTPGTKGLLP